MEEYANATAEHIAWENAAGMYVKDVLRVPINLETLKENFKNFPLKEFNQKLTRKKADAAKALDKGATGFKCRT